MSENLIDRLKIAAKKLNSMKLRYALAGGLAASIYRKQPRLTQDIDFAILSASYKRARAMADKILLSMDLKPILGWADQSRTKAKRNVAFVLGRPRAESKAGAVDIILPCLPWVKRAVTRAQSNVIDFGGVLVPTLTPEDVIIAKAFALQSDPLRFQDLDDIKEILLGPTEIDLTYIVSEFERLSLVLPKELEGALPSFVVRVFRRVRRKGE